MRRVPGWLMVTLAATAVALSTVSGSTSTQSKPRKKLLLLTHNAFYKHSSLEPAERAVAEFASQGGFDVTSLEGYKQPADRIDLSMISAAYLKQFDAVMMMTNGELPMIESQKQALVDFVRNGKGFVAVHQTMVTFYSFPQFGEMLGAYMSNGPIFDTMNRQKRIATLKVEDPRHPATKMLGSRWVLHDEIYQFATKVWDPATPKENVGPTGHPVPIAFSRDRVNVLLSVDSEQTDFTGLTGWVRGGDYPQAWYHFFGRGRSIYTSLGHRDDLWSGDPTFRAHILGAIRWALALED